MTSDDASRPRRVGWDVDAIVRRVHLKHGTDQRFLAEPALRGMGERQAWAKFHLNEVYALFDRLDREVIQGRHLFEFVGDSDDGDRFLRDQSEIGAHAMAAAQSMHAIADITAHAVYYSLALDKGSTAIKKARDINHKGVTDALPPGALKVALNSVASGDNWEHLAAIVNVSKHRSVVPSRIAFDVEGLTDRRHWLRFDAVTYQDPEPYPQTEVAPFLHAELFRISTAMQSVIEALDAALA